MLLTVLNRKINYDVGDYFFLMTVHSCNRIIHLTLISQIRILETIKEKTENIKQFVSENSVLFTITNNVNRHLLKYKMFEFLLDFCRVLCR